MKKLLIFLVLILVLATILFASSILRLPLKELPSRSDYIVLANVIKVMPSGKLIDMDIVTIEIVSALKGEIKEKEVTFVLNTRGGLKDFDPQLKVGDKGVFFLNKNNEEFEKAYWGSIAIFPKDNFE